VQNIGVKTQQLIFLRLCLLTVLSSTNGCLPFLGNSPNEPDSKDGSIIGGTTRGGNAIRFPIYFDQIYLEKPTSDRLTTLIDREVESDSWDTSASSSQSGSESQIDVNICVSGLAYKIDGASQTISFNKQSGRGPTIFSLGRRPVASVAAIELLVDRLADYTMDLQLGTCVNPFASNEMFQVQVRNSLFPQLGWISTWQGEGLYDNAQLWPLRYSGADLASLAANSQLYFSFPDLSDRLSAVVNRAGLAAAIQNGSIGEFDFR
jgi:hypothetical protein